jgi:hypothetical protein
MIAIHSIVYWPGTSSITPITATMSMIASAGIPGNRRAADVLDRTDGAKG